jgi:hypothetical protein
MLVRRKNKERGFTLLEYCAGAAVVAGVIWVALSSLGGSMSTLLGNVGKWADSRAAEVQK